jgi:hypothetical protein
MSSLLKLPIKPIVEPPPIDRGVLLNSGVQRQDGDAGQGSEWTDSDPNPQIVPG